MNPIHSELLPGSLPGPPLAASALPESAPEECVVCREPLFNGRSVVILPCQHRFHNACNDAWIDGRQLGDWTCILCNTTPKTLDIVALNDNRYASLAHSSESLKLQLFKACQDGNVATVIGAVEKDPSLITGTIKLEDLKGHYGPIHVASLYGHLPIVEFLLTREVDINLPEEDGILSPIELAAREGFVELVSCLTKRDAKDLNSALLLATHYGHVNVVRKLIDNGADINHVHEVILGNKLIRYTPLVSSVTSKSAAQLVELLISKDAKVTDEALWVAVGLDKLDIVKLLITHTDVNAMDGWIICAAARFNRLEIVKVLLASGAEIDKPYDVETALGYAAEYGCVDMIHLLVDAGASLESTVLSNGKRSLSPLCIATYARQQDCIKALIERGSGIDNADFRGLTPLTQAILANNIDQVRELVEHFHASVNCSPNYSIPWANVIPHELFRRREQFVISPLAFAVHLGRSPITQFLIDSGAEINALHGLALRLAIVHDNAGILLKLIHGGADLCGVFDNGETPLALANRLKRSTLVMELLSHGAPASEISLAADFRDLSIV
ncbi:ankyrin repeat domain-containing protein [Salinisphaera sp. G21_0]|uniref:ankyrin repeat domain-containing protein n=1 Tax=Salinisphaera sp. G21_0 TaxID=2821094 RepID=UPI001ADB2A17|nr:ankyrin repeat domain-containing protein [Salinisphaera sp. G21_0]MBO9480028.1 ankyrin repeat domain-containing protein [Salinisphaera sp. G21_0]